LCCAAILQAASNDIDGKPLPGPVRLRGGRLHRGARRKTGGKQSLLELLVSAGAVRDINGTLFAAAIDEDKPSYH
jgi:hypothetical protein